MIRWALAKYVKDIHRNEPINVGLFLFSHDLVRAQFRSAEDDKPHFVMDPDNYTEWQDYWWRCLNQFPSYKQFMNGVYNSPSYYVQAAGRRLLGGRETNSHHLFQELYNSLVAVK